MVHALRARCWRAIAAALGVFLCLLAACPIASAQVGPLQAQNNLGDLPSPATARVNLGLGALATANYPPSGIVDSSGSALGTVTVGNCLSYSAGTLSNTCGMMAASNTSLESLSTATYAQVLRTGFASAGDSPPVTYVATSSACSLNSGAGDGGSQVKSSNSECWVAEFPAVGADIRDWGVVMNSGSDQTTAAQAAINYSESAGICILIPAGTVLTTTGLSATSDPCIIGAGVDQSYIETASATINMIAVSGTGGFYMANLTLQNNATTPTAGSGLDITGTGGNDTLRDVNVQYFYDGVIAATTGLVTLDHVASTQVRWDGFQISNTNDFFCNFCSTFQGGSYYGNAGFDILSGSGIHLNHGFTGANTHAILIYPTTGATVSDVFVDNYDFDDSQGTGCDIDSSGGGTIYTVKFVNDRCSFSSGDGVYVNGTNTTDVSLINQTATRNLHHGINISGGTEVQVLGGWQSGNGAEGGTYAGDYLNGGTDVSVLGVHANGSETVGASQAYGVWITASFSSVANLADNILTGNLTAAVSNASSSTGIVFANNAGYNPVGVTGSITVGTSPATICAGPSSETDYFLQGATDTATVKIGGYVVGTMTYPTVPVVTNLGPNECEVVTWATTAPTYTRSVH